MLLPWLVLVPLIAAVVCFLLPEKASRFFALAVSLVGTALGVCLYVHFDGAKATELQMAFSLPSAPDRIIGVALSRADPDFTDAERDLLNRARPLLIQAFRAAVEHDELLRALAGMDGQAARTMVTKEVPCCALSSAVSPVPRALPVGVLT